MYQPLTPSKLIMSSLLGKLGTVLLLSAVTDGEQVRGAALAPAQRPDR